MDNIPEVKENKASVTLLEYYSKGKTFPPAVQVADQLGRLCVWNI